jgi:hypothetical protein
MNNFRTPVLAISAIVGIAVVATSAYVGAHHDDTLTVGSIQITEARWSPEGTGWRRFRDSYEAGDAFWNPFANEKIQIIRRGDAAPSVIRPADLKPDFVLTGVWWRTMDAAEADEHSKVSRLGQ